MTSDHTEELLARRYEWLIRAYPADFRRRRGQEMVGLMLDSAEPGQRWPTPSDAADLLIGGLRRRIVGFRLSVITGLLSAAGPVALALAAGLSLFWLTGYELAGEPNMRHEGASPLGPFETSAPNMYAGWVLTAAFVCLVGRYGRQAVLLAVALVMAMPYLADLFDLTPPPGEFLLLTNLSYLEAPTLDFDTVLIVLGLVALAIPARPTPRTRLAIALGTVAVVGVAWSGGWVATRADDYHYVLRGATAGAGIAAAAAILVCLGIAVERARHTSWRQGLVPLFLATLPLLLPAQWVTHAF